MNVYKLRDFKAGARALTLFTATFLAGCAGAAGAPDEAETGSDEALLSGESLLPTTSSQYRLPATIDPDILSDRATEIWARVYRPIHLKNKKHYPLLVFLHGNHGTCGTGVNPRIDSSCEYTESGTCPAGFVVTPNHEGYAYVASDLAARGYIVVSINANRGITCGGGAPGDFGLNLARGRLVLKHLQLLSRWNRGIEPTPASLGFDLRDHLDFEELGFMGHSRGGEGVRAAYEQFRDLGSPWPTRIATSVRFRGIFEIGPVDGQTDRVLNIDGVPWTVLLPMCDGDVSDLQGIKPFDRVLGAFAESPASMKASFTVWGANHNFYNTEWQVSDSGGCTDHAPIFSTASGIIGSPEQRETSRIGMRSFFTSNVGNQAVPTRARLFDPLFALPAQLTDITRVDRGFTPSPNTRFTLVLEDFVGPTGTSTFGLPHDTSRILISHGAVPEHDSTFRGATISWTEATPSTYFQSNWAEAGTGFRLTNHDTLDFRVDRAFDPLNPPAPTNFTVQLVDSQNRLSRAVSVQDFVDLRGPVGGQFDFLRHSMLQTVRIPLRRFEPTNLRSIRAIRFTFDKTASGSIYLGNIRALRQPRVDEHDDDCKRDHHLEGKGSARAASELASADAVEIELDSAQPFVPRDEMLTLRIGVYETAWSRHPNGDTRRVVFRVSRSDFNALRSGDPMTVLYGDGRTGPVWKFGRLDKLRWK